jgi:SAM-dependent methyltransferase
LIRAAADGEEVSMDWQQIQQDWDAQQEIYLPDREQRFGAMLDTVEAIAGTHPRILDLAGGTGSITLRTLQRFPRATSVIVDVDAALLAIASGTFVGDDRVTVLAADLSTRDWRTKIDAADSSFDAVLTATALHWLPAERVAELYAEAGQLLRPGGIFANADHMADDGLPTVTESLTSFCQVRHDRLMTAPDALDWEGWWAALRTDPELAAAVAARDAHFAERAGSAHTESTMPAAWHIAAFHAAGYAEAGLVWRGLRDAVVVAAR